MQINLAVFLAVFFLFEYGKFIYGKSYRAVFDPLRAQENPRFLGVPMKIFKFIGLVLWIQAVQVSASDSFVRIQASPNESIVHSSSGATTEQKSNAIVISTPTPRERVVSPSAQSIAPMPIIIQPNMPPAKTNKTSKAVDQKNSIKE